MRVKGLISVILALAMVCSGINAMAAGELLTENYTDATSGSKPTNFTTWLAGGTTNPKPTISVETNALGKGATDVSGVITWPTNSKATYKPRVRGKMTSVTTTNTINLSFSAAAGDKKSSKAVYLSDSTTAIDSDADATVVFATDGGIYTYGQKIADYDVNTWYHFDVEVADGDCTVYLDGKTAYTTQDVSGAVAATMYLTYGMYGKTSDGDEAVFYTDDFAVGYGAVDAARKTDVTSREYNGIGGSLISGISSGTTVSEFLTGFSAGSASLSVVDGQGVAVAGTSELALGMKLKITSADGVNTRYYSLDCVNAAIICDINGGETRSPSQEVTVTFDGTGVVDFYVNGSPQETVSSAPYTITVNHTESGLYSVYGVIRANGETQRTDTVSYTYTANIAPTVSVSGITEGAQYSITDTFSVTVSAADTDGWVDDIEVKLDGREITSNSSGAYTFGPLSLGNHTLVVTATDGEGGVGVQSLSFLVENNKRVPLGNIEGKADFGNVAMTFNGASSEIVDDADSIDGYYIRFESENAAIGFTNSDFQASAAPLSNKVYIEYDLMLSDTTVKSIILYLSQRDSQGEKAAVSFYIESGKLGDVSITPGEWNHYKFEFDIPNGVAKAYVLNKDTSAYVLATTLPVTEQLWGGFEFYLNQQSSEVALYAGFDNFEAYYITSDSYLASVDYLMEDGSSATEEDGRISYDLSTIKLNFNNELSTTLTQDNCVTLTQNGVEVDDLEAVVVGNAIEISLGKELKTQADYTLSYTGVVDSNDKSVADGTVRFTTAPGDYDMLGTTVKVNGNTVTSLSGIISGNTTIDVSANFINKANIPMNSKLVVVLYSGNKCLGMTVTDMSVLANTPSVNKNASAITVPANREIDDTVRLYAYVWSDLAGTRTSQVKAFTME